MANEAVIISLGHDDGSVIRRNCADGFSITKGTLLKLFDPNTVSGASVRGSVFGGIAAMDKVASDGSSTIAVYTRGVFDLVSEAAGITVGDMVCISGANIVGKAIAADLLTGSVVGKAEETGTSSEVIRVRLMG